MVATSSGIEKKSKINAFFSSSFFRIAVGVLIFSTAIAVILPRVIYFKSVNAVVSGQLSYFIAPIEGRVEGDLPKVGDFVDADVTLLHLQNDRLDRGFLFNLITERDSLSSRVSALEKQESLTIEYFDDLQIQTKEWQLAAIEALDGEYAQVELEKKAALVNLDVKKAQIGRLEMLRDAGHGTLKELDETRANVRWQEFEVERLDENLRYLHALRSQIEKGVFIASSRFGTPYYEQRGDELKIRLLDLQAKKIEAEARMKHITTQIENEQTRLQKTGDATIMAPFAGVVWEVNAVPGREMLLGEDLLALLDCNSTFLDVLVPETRYEDIRIGDKIEYRLYGETEYRNGFVKGRRGSAGTAENKTLATRTVSKGTDAFRIEVDLGEYASQKADFCNVGRRAEVRFDTGISNWEEKLWFSVTSFKELIFSIIPNSSKA